MYYYIFYQCCQYIFTKLDGVCQFLLNNKCTKHMFNKLSRNALVATLGSYTLKLVLRSGIEPPADAVSEHCSTSELPQYKIGEYRGIRTHVTTVLQTAPFDHFGMHSLNLVPVDGIEPPSEAYKTSASPLMLNRHNILVDNGGVEPPIQACKASVIPI